ncbi:hypothetical protein SAMN03080594_102322 [Arenibacter palladensis]|uniref:Uncharacterized protein n=1 Tax=Arenibacter palladensis TaxID=237373 RepID=A0A1M4Y5I8_9FLAO|nr:hypothetical protein SAMN03080594_102322 [Arenibacter palladensis]
MEPKMKYLSLHPYVGIIQIRSRVLSQLGFYQAPRAFVLINVRLKFKILSYTKCFKKVNCVTQVSIESIHNNCTWKARSLGNATVHIFGCKGKRYWFKMGWLEELNTTCLKCIGIHLRYIAI